jgi:hypothetical protein
MDLDKSAEKPGVKATSETKAPQKKPYAPPRLTVYGHISKLTTGGSGSHPEANSQMGNYT